MRQLRLILLTVMLTMISCLVPMQAHADGEMDKVYFKVYLNPAGAPFAAFTNDITTMHGVDVDIIQEMQRRLGFLLVDDRIYPLNPDAAIPMMRDKRIDLYGGGMGFDAALNREFATLPIYIKSSLGVLYSTTHNSDIKSTQDLKGKKIGVVKGSSAEQFVTKYGGEVVYENNLSYSIFMVTQGSLDAFIYDRLVLENFIKNVAVSNLKILPEEFGRNYCQYTFYISKLSPYRRALTKTLQDMLNDGTVNSILKKWGIEVKKPPVRKRKSKAA